MCATTFRDLVDGMNALTDEPLLDYEDIEREMIARDREVDNKYSKDFQVTAIHGARNLLADKIVRVVAPHKILDPKNGPLIAVRLHLLTRKTLGRLGNQPGFAGHQGRRQCLRRSVRSR